MHASPQKSLRKSQLKSIRRSLWKTIRKGGAFGGVAGILAKVLIHEAAETEGIEGTKGTKGTKGTEGTKGTKGTEAVEVLAGIRMAGARSGSAQIAPPAP